MFSHAASGAERLTTQIADAIVRIFSRAGVVVVEAEHTSCLFAGAQAGSMTVTSAMRGTLLNAATRAEAMALIKDR